MELGALLPLAISLASARGYAADEVKDALTRAREICGLMGDAAPLFPVLHGLSKFWTVRGDQIQAEELIRTCAKIADETGAPLYVVESDATLAYVLNITGQFGDEILMRLKRAPRGLRRQRGGLPRQLERGRRQDLRAERRAERALSHGRRGRRQARQSTPLSPGRAGSAGRSISPIRCASPRLI